MREDFFERIKFDTKDLLNPRVCQGKEIVPNILITLGVNEKLVRNPVLKDEFSEIIKMILTQHGIELTERPNRKQIDIMVEAIKASEMLSDKQIYELSKRGILKSRNGIFGISINPETGSFEIQKVYETIDDKNDNTFNIIVTYSIDKDHNASENEKIYLVDVEGINNYLLMDTDLLYNDDGVKLLYEVKHYRYEDYQQYLDYHEITKRDKKYPFIADEQIFINELGYGNPPRKSYYFIDTMNFASLDHYYEQTENEDEVISIYFDKYDEIEDFYNENKDEIVRNIERPYFLDSQGVEIRLEERIQEGIKKIAREAGIIPEVKATNAFTGISEYILQ